MELFKLFLAAFLSSITFIHSHNYICKPFVDYAAKKPCPIYDLNNCKNVDRYPVDCPILSVRPRYPCTRHLCSFDQSTTTASTTTTIITSTISSTTTTTSYRLHSIGKYSVFSSVASSICSSPFPSCNNAGSKARFTNI
jgi:hypothetical protein